jgi:hypothetical protein
MAQPALPCRAIITAQVAGAKDRGCQARWGGGFKAKDPFHSPRTVSPARSGPEKAPGPPTRGRHRALRLAYPGLQESQPDQRAPCLRLPPTPYASGPTQAATRSLSEGVLTTRSRASLRLRAPAPGSGTVRSSRSQPSSQPNHRQPGTAQRWPSRAVPCRAIISSQVPGANDQGCQARGGQVLTRRQCDLKASPGGQADAFSAFLRSGGSLPATVGVTFKPGQNTKARLKAPIEPSAWL